MMQDIYYVAGRVGTDVGIYDLNTTTGQRKLFTRYSPSDKTATVNVTYVTITPDGAPYAYVIPHVYSPLFVAKGVR